MSSVWKRVQKTFSRQSKPGVGDVVDEAVEANRKSKSTKGNNKTGGSPARRPKKNRALQDDYDNDEMRDVLQLFNRLEELVVEGDPRVRQVLDRRPLVQQALMEEGNLTDRSDFSPRPTIPKLQFGSPREATFYREESGVSGRPAMYKDKQLTVSDLGPRNPQPARYLNERYVSNNSIVMNRTIPEEGVMNNTYQINNYQGGKIRRHPDGTMLTTTNGPTIQDRQINDVNPSFTRSLPQPVTSNPPENRFSKPPQQARSQREITVPKLDLHEFNYETPRGKSKVQVKLRGDDKSHNFNYTNPDAGYQVRVSLDNLPLPPNPDRDIKLAEEAAPVAPLQRSEPITQNIGLPAPMKRDPIFAKRSNNPSWMDVTSKVLTSEGGELSCSSCRITVPKNAIPTKGLIRLSVMDIQQVPFTSKLPVISDRTPDLLPISAAISMEPQNLQLNKPITVRLITSIAKINENGGTIPETKQSKNLKGTEGDIKAKDIVIKYQNVYTSNSWQNLDVDIFRSSDSVVFQTQELANVCAFHVMSDQDILVKKIAVYLFKSMERRKKQFLSILVCEDQPHVLQKGIESMPGWLHYMDSCFNVSMEYGRNLAIFLEPKDRTLCSIDANKMEIPWENLWRPECIIRKHFMVTLHKLDVEAPVQLMVNEANYTMIAPFAWQIQKKTIFLPDPVPLQDYTYEPEQDKIDEYLLDNRPKEHSTLYKHVSWKPETPEQNGVTNESLLRYAKM